MTTTTQMKPKPSDTVATERTAETAAVRSSDMFRCELTKIEAAHLVRLIEVNERDGWYYGIAAQYWVRSDRIKEKLQAPNAPDR